MTSTSPAPAPRILSVNVGGIRHVDWRGRDVTTGIWKHAVAGRVALAGVNFAGDDQADRTVHGGPDKAVYAYAREDYEYWRANGMDAPDAMFGENLTTEGVDLASCIVGERWTVGSTTLEIAQPRLPCYKLGIRVGDATFLKRFLLAQRVGAYLRVVQEGDIGAGDKITVISRPSHGVTLRNMVESLNDPDRAAELRAVPRLPGFWQEIAERGT
jgi:MOSC domain-containing protein YiiM